MLVGLIHGCDYSSFIHVYTVGLFHPKGGIQISTRIIRLIHYAQLNSCVTYHQQRMFLPVKTYEYLPTIKEESFIINAKVITYLRMERE